VLEKTEINLNEWFDLLLQNETNDIELYKSLLSNSNEPILELFSNTGRLTFELLKVNLNVDCLENNEDFIFLAKEKFVKYGYQCKFYNQNILNLSLPGKYNTIISPSGSFLLFENTENAITALKKIYIHLNNGGKFILDIFIPWQQIIANQQNLWKIGRIAENKEKSEKLIVYYSEKFDLKKQIRFLDTKYELYHNNTFVSSYFESSHLKWFSIDEFKLMLEKVGFSKIETRDVKIYSNQGESTLYIAHKLE